MDKRKSVFFMIFLLAVYVVICAASSAFATFRNGVEVSREAVTNSEIVLEKQQEDKPSFSFPSGFYPALFILELSYSDPEAKIYYTTDGREPTTDSELYENGILLLDRTDQPNYLSSFTGVSPDEDYLPNVPVIKANVIRAIAVKPDGTTSLVANGTYFIGQDRKELYGETPVILMYVDPENLFSHDQGIYVLGQRFDEWQEAVQTDASLNPNRPKGNYSQKGKEWERPATIEYLPGDETDGFTADLGVRIMGGDSRSRMQKSFRFRCRDEYGAKNIKYELIADNERSDGNGTVRRYKSFLLRNGGNDCNKAKIRDPLIQDLVAGCGLETQETEPVILFINGEYWGCYTLCEDYSNHYIENNYGVADENVVIVKNGAIEEGKDEDMTLFDEMCNFITENDMADAKNYRKACRMLDVEGFSKYCALNIYICNNDSIFLNDNNWMMWRVRETNSRNEFSDGKWRLMVFDTDYSTGIDETAAADVDMIPVACDETADCIGCRLLCALLANEDFRNGFVSDLGMMRNEVFEKNRVRARLEEFRAVYAPLIPDTFDRFGPESITQFYDPNDYFNEQLDRIGTWFDEKYELFPAQVEEHFGIDISGTL